MEIGISTLGLYPAKTENILEFTAQNKIKHLEIISEYPYNDITSETFNSYDISTTLHAPISDMNIASHVEKIRQASINEIERTIQQAINIDATTITFHPGKISQLALEYTEKILEYNTESIAILDKKAEEYGVNLCIENMPLEDNQLYPNLEALYDAIENMTNMKITLDVGHAHNNGYTVNQMLSCDKIHHINLDDNDGSYNSHNYLGSGTIDFGGLFDELDKKNYHGTCIIEVNSMIEIYKSIDYLKTIKIL